MSEGKRTFTDPETGEEIESTWLARWGGTLIFSLTLGVGVGVGGWLQGLYKVSFPRNFFMGLIYGLFIGAMVAILAKREKMDRLGQRIHDSIARRQHFRQQRLFTRKLLEEEWAGVPNKALSQAQTTGPPQPTDVSLSPADLQEEEKPRLAVAVEENQKGLWHTIKARWER